MLLPIGTPDAISSSLFMLQYSRVPPARKFFSVLRKKQKSPPLGKVEVAPLMLLIRWEAVWTKSGKQWLRRQKVVRAIKC